MVDWNGVDLNTDDDIVLASVQSGFGNGRLNPLCMPIRIVIANLANVIVIMMLLI